MASGFRTPPPPHSVPAALPPSLRNSSHAMHRRLWPFSRGWSPGSLGTGAGFLLCRRERSSVFALTLASDQHPGLSSHSLCLSRKYVQTHLSSLPDEPGAPGLSAVAEHPGEMEGSRAPWITCPTCQPAPLFTPGGRLRCCGHESPKGTGSGVGSGSREGPPQRRASSPAPLENLVGEKRSKEQKSPQRSRRGSPGETWLFPPRVVAPLHWRDSWLLLSSMQPPLRTSPVDPQRRKWGSLGLLCVSPSC